VFSQASADTAQLRTAVGPATPEGDARRERSGAEPRAREQWNGPPIIGQSAPMQAVRRLIEMAAPTPAPVLITGETGTGKELVAQTLHALSSRARGPFVAINSSPDLRDAGRR
jgi:DNA-binding NtrC family response regulator